MPGKCLKRRATSAITCFTNNWANRVDIIVLGGVNNGGVFYGRTSMTMEENSNGNVSYYMLYKQLDGRK